MKLPRCSRCGHPESAHPWDRCEWSEAAARYNATGKPERFSPCKCPEWKAIAEPRGDVPR